jgi:hypothetical protein
MKIVIENAETQEFLTADGKWTRNSKQAAVYSNTTTAKARGASAPIGRFNVVGTFKDSPQITNLDEGSGTGKASGI